MSGGIGVEELGNAMAMAYGDSEPVDREFGNADLVDYDGMRVLEVEGVLPGGITVVDDGGEVVVADQMELERNGVIEGVRVVMDAFLVGGLLPGTWKIRYNRGMKGADALDGGLSPASAEQLMLYSIVFG